MTDVTRHLRSLGIALTVLAISGTAVFAAAPIASRLTAETETPSATATETASAGDEDQDEDQATETTEATDAEATEDPSESPAADDTHGALVSTAAQMDTPEGFANHGQFVRCVAQMDATVTLATIDWTTVTAESCGVTSPDADKAAAGKAKGAEHKAAGQAKSQAGRDKAAGHAPSQP